MEKKEVIAELLKNGATRVNGLKVRNVSVTRCENYVRVGLTLDKSVKGMVTKDNGVTHEEGETNVIFVSLYGITSILKDNDEAAFAANHIIENPDALSVVLSRATINILQEPIKTGEEYKNPWSTNAEATVFDHDTIINHVIDITLSDFGIRKLDRIADSLLGIK